MLESGEVEELASFVDVRPEAVLHRLLGAAERRGVGEGVEVSEHAHDTGKAVHLVRGRGRGRGRAESRGVMG